MQMNIGLQCFVVRNLETISYSFGGTNTYDNVFETVKQFGECVLR